MLPLSLANIVLKILINKFYFLIIYYTYISRVSPVKCGQDRYKNQPRPIENYEPGHSSIAEKETKEFWDEAMNAFDGVSQTLSSLVLIYT